MKILLKAQACIEKRLFFQSVIESASIRLEFFETTRNSYVLTFRNKLTFPLKNPRKIVQKERVCWGENVTTVKKTSLERKRVKKENVHEKRRKC